MSLTLFISTNKVASHPSEPDSQTSVKTVAGKRVSRFLQQKTRNPNAADHCNKDNEVCNYITFEGRNTTCCNNKCLDLKYDNKNCGACKKKCAVSEECCRGECVNLAYDKRHCGYCNNRRKNDGICIYGTCDYA
ncbi:hypothetical protein ACJIZ3_005508 [Penstemon smallii]|uniref:Stigma-specific STIG1-like protein 1 n=1 Tax=Penstemon smallii TaxID=265156 RepID=A0ABD3S543_9LAMI